MQILSVLAIGIFTGAAASDIARRRIPNPLVVALLVLGLLRLGLAAGAGVGLGVLGADLGASLAVLMLGAGVFQFGVIGGGDAKLLAAGALWIGAAELGPYLMITALAGGALALLFLARGLASRHRAAHSSLPYGVAIAAGGILGTLAAL